MHDRLCGRIGLEIISVHEPAEHGGHRRVLQAHAAQFRNVDVFGYDVEARIELGVLRSGDVRYIDADLVQEGRTQVTQRGAVARHAHATVGGELEGIFHQLGAIDVVTLAAVDCIIVRNGGTVRERLRGAMDNDPRRARGERTVLVAQQHHAAFRLGKKLIERLYDGAGLDQRLHHVFLPYTSSLTMARCEKSPSSSPSRAMREETTAVPRAMRMSPVLNSMFSNLGLSIV